MDDDSNGDSNGDGDFSDEKKKRKINKNQLQKEIPLTVDTCTYYLCQESPRL